MCAERRNIAKITYVEVDNFLLATIKAKGVAKFSSSVESIKITAMEQRVYGNKFSSYLLNHYNVKLIRNNVVE